MTFKNAIEQNQILVLLLVSAGLAVAICWPLGFREYYQLAITKGVFFVVGCRILGGDWPFFPSNSTSNEINEQA